MVEVKKLTKNYGNIKAVDNISFTVGEGESSDFLARTVPENLPL